MGRNQKIKRLVILIIPCLVLLTTPFLAEIFNNQLKHNIKFRAILMLIILIGGFYLNYFLLIPKLLFKKKMTGYSAVVFGVIILMTLISFIVERIFVIETLSTHLFPLYYTPLWLLMLVGLGLSVQMTNYWFRQDKLHIEIEQEQLKTELAFLKNQISPHFFFNVLNNIYALTEINHTKARDVTHQLSKLMRYLLYESEKNELVTLGREITFLKTYIELMKIRLSETISLSFDHSSETDNTELPALLFISFVENAFKHGISLQENCSIKITLHKRSDTILFSVINTIPTMKEPIKSQGGMGILNIKRRLALLYNNNNYELKIIETMNVYDVRLKLHI